MTYEVTTLEDVLNRLSVPELVIDAEGAVLGRLASYVAKLALMGVRVYVVNVEKAVITGDKKRVVDSYKLLLEVKTHKNPYRHAPHRPRNPINIFKKAVKGMLPKENWLGKLALKRVKAYIGFPEELKNKPVIKIVDTLAEHLKRREYITVDVVAKELGWKGVGL